MHHKFTALIALVSSSTLVMGCTTEEEVVDAEPVQFNINLENISSEGDLVPSSGTPTNIMFAPGILIIHDGDFSLFESGSPAKYAGFEAMVEDGSNAGLVDDLAGEPGVIEAISYAALDASYADSPMLPGTKATKSSDAVPGDFITVATMFGESNDVFVAALAIPLFDADGVALETDATGDLTLWDAGTEVNEEPGLGENQAPRQAAPGSGVDEDANVEQITGTDAAGFSYPEPDAMLSLRITVAE